jgi:hypothetical protein
MVTKTTKGALCVGLAVAAVGAFIFSPLANKLFGPKEVAAPKATTLNNNNSGPTQNKDDHSSGVHVEGSANGSLLAGHDLNVNNQGPLGFTNVSVGRDFNLLIPEKPKRQVSVNQATLFSNLVSRVGKSNVFVSSYFSGDREAQLFANQVANLFSQAGYTTRGNQYVNALDFFPPGLSIVTSDNGMKEPEIVRTIEAFVQSVGVSGVITNSELLLRETRIPFPDGGAAIAVLVGPKQ